MTKKVDAPVSTKPVGPIYVLPSLFTALPRSVSFNHDVPGSRPYTGTGSLILRMSGAKTNIVRETFRASGFKNINTARFTVHWGKAQKYKYYKELGSLQWVSHFPGTFELGRKDRLARNLAHLSRRFGSRVYGFFTPATYIIPADYKALKSDMAEKKALYIMKPCASARGIGIKLIDSISAVNKTKYALVQKYLGAPYLIDGRKSDIRLYVAITNVDPMKFYIYPEGLVRFATKQYKKGQKSSKMMHLTNYSINVKSDDFVQPTADLPTFTTHDPPPFDEEWFRLSKWSLSMLASYMGAEGTSYSDVWGSITDVVTRAVLAGDGPLNTAFKANCQHGNAFELFGVDIMLDSALRPWLIEINTSPSTASSSPLDKVIKQSVLSDLCDLVGFAAPKTPIPPRLPRVKRTFKDLDVFIPAELPTHAKEVLQALEDEMHRAGRWSLLFPAADSPYLRILEVPRYNNILCSKWLACRAPLSVLGAVDPKLVAARRKHVHSVNPTPPDTMTRPVLGARPRTTTTGDRARRPTMSPSPGHSRVGSGRVAGRALSPGPTRVRSSGMHVSPTARPRAASAGPRRVGRTLGSGTFTFF